ncbi:ATP-binding ABC transporter, partial [Gregarina niphandrodes]
MIDSYLWSKGTTALNSSHPSNWSSSTTQRTVGFFGQKQAYMACVFTFYLVHERSFQTRFAYYQLPFQLTVLSVVVAVLTMALVLERLTSAVLAICKRHILVTLRSPLTTIIEICYPAMATAVLLMLRSSDSDKPKQNTLRAGSGSEYICWSTIWATVFLSSNLKFVQTVMEEKESKVREFIQIYGASETAYWASHYLSIGLFAVVQSLLVCAVTMAFLGLSGVNNGFVTYVSLFCLIVCFEVSCVSTGILATSFTDSARASLFIFGTVYIVMMVPYLKAVHDVERGDSSRIGGWDMFMSPQSALVCGLDQLLGGFISPAAYDYEDISRCDTPQAVLYLLYLLDGLVYAMLGWYLHQIRPGQMGIPRRWDFIFRSSYWNKAEALQPRRKVWAQAQVFVPPQNQSDLFEPDDNDLPRLGHTSSRPPSRETLTPGRPPTDQLATYPSLGRLDENVAAHTNRPLHIGTHTRPAKSNESTIADLVRDTVGNENVNGINLNPQYSQVHGSEVNGRNIQGLKTSALNTSALDTSALNTSALNASALNASALNASALNASASLNMLGRSGGRISTTQSPGPSIRGTRERSKQGPAPGTPRMPLIIVDQVHKIYVTRRVSWQRLKNWVKRKLDIGLIQPPSGQHVLKGISFRVCAGQLVVFMGRNGSGASTLLSIIGGLQDATSGNVFISGHDIHRHVSAARRRIGYCPQTNFFLDRMTIGEQMSFAATLKGVPRHIANCDIEVTLRMLELYDKIDWLPHRLSHGEKKRVAIAMALIGNPRCIVIDDLSTGLDVLSRRVIWRTLRELKQNRAIVVSTHCPNEADFIADKLGVLEGGTLKALGSPLFLKTRFDDGYCLSLYDSGRIENLSSKLLSVIGDYSTDIVPASAYGIQLSYKLPYKCTRHIPTILQILEQKQ